MLDIERELKYPLLDDSWLKKILIGGILNIIPVISFLPWGYAYRIFRKTLQGEDVLPLPPWDRWKEDFISGFKIFVLAVLWAVIPLILFKVSALLGLLAVAAAGILFPMALACYAAEERFTHAFRVQHIWQRIRSTRDRYASAWLTCCVLFIVGLFIWRLPVIGYPLGAFLFFYILLVYARLFGLVCRSEQPLPATTETAVETGPEDSSPPSA
ncbi:MAG: DUF4013 domain-containing protein [Deltaproteobacteria bacterium]|nr:DUF4013 domain-containing protein [Deltaproteobacteria bacterium]MBW2305799.1 DUF4013 domain-containing protein [Deltaproteobacteria bacterium]